MIEVFNSGTARWKRCIGERAVWGKGIELPCLPSECHSPWITTCSSTWKCSETSPFGFLWRFHYIGLIDWLLVTKLNLKPLSPAWRLGDGTERSKPLIMWFSLGFRGWLRSTFFPLYLECFWDAVMFTPLSLWWWVTFIFRLPAPIFLATVWPFPWPH